MDHVLAILDNAVLQGLGYGIAVVGVALSFRVLRYPDLTADGSFLIGAATFSAAIMSGIGWFGATLLAISGGGGAGLVTALLHSCAGVNRLLSGILTAMICYSVAFWVLAGRSNVNLAGASTLYSATAAVDADAAWSRFGAHPATIALSALIASVVLAGVYVLLKSQFGIVLRGTGENESLIEGLGRRPQRYYAAGLALANGLVGLSGGLIAARQGFADVNMGVGVIITLVAALVIGEEVIRLIGLNPALSLAARTLSGVLGACVYFFLYLLILRASILGWIPVRIQPTDLKLMSALIVVAFVVLRTRMHRHGEPREEVLPI